MPAESRNPGSRKKRSKTDPKKPVKPKSLSLKTARIHSAVVKGKQTLLPSETKGLNLSKFEHNGRDGRLSVYAEELHHMYDVSGHYKVIATFRPVNSVQNQLFFGKTAYSQKVGGIRQSSCADEQTRFPTLTGRPKNRLQTKPDSFEELILRYKAQREQNHTGKQHLEVLDMLDSIYKRKKEQWTRIEREFSSLEKVRRELGKQEIEMELRRKAESGKHDSDFILPVIKVSSVHDHRAEKQRKVSKQDSKRLKIPKDCTGSFRKYTTGIIRNSASVAASTKK